MATNAVTPPNFYKPSELLGIFKNFFSNKEINAQVVTLHDVYFKSNKIYDSVAYDQIRDENTTDSFTIVIPVSLRETLQNGNLISVQGILDRRAQNNGSIQFLLNVSRVDVIKDIAISEDEIKRAEFSRVKEQRGYKNVDSLLEDKLFRDLTPLTFQTSILCQRIGIAKDGFYSSMREGHKYDANDNQYLDTLGYDYDLSF